MTPEVSHSAEAWLNILRGKIDAQIRALLHPHHIAHEPGGSDAIGLPVIALDDVDITSRPDDGDTLVYVQGATEADDYWTNGPGGGGGSRQFGYQVPGELAISGGGPTIPNITGTTITFTTAIATVGTAPIDDDITCELDVDGTTVSFTIGNGTTSSTKQTGLSVAWAADSLITGSISQVGSTTPGSDLSMVLAE